MQQEHQRTEQTARERSAESTAIRGGKVKRTLELVDSKGLTATTIYGAVGSITPDGTFTGAADSVRTVATKEEQKTTDTEEHEQHDSVVTGQHERLTSTVEEHEHKDKDVDVKHPLIPWWLWLCIAALSVFALWFGTPLKRIFKLFK